MLYNWKVEIIQNNITSGSYSIEEAKNTIKEYVNESQSRDDVRFVIIRNLIRTFFDY